MWRNKKRVFALLLALALLAGFLPAQQIQAKAATQELTEAAYASADLVFEKIDAMEAAPAKKNATQDAKTEAAIQIVTASEGYVEGSLERNGNAFSWWTEDGIRCMYNPRIQKIQEKQTPESGENAIINEPAAVRGGTPAGKQVYLVGPYYGMDDDFTDQYKKEAKRVAAAIGDTDGYTVYSGTAATVDKVAEAISNGAVVFFDSHGTTDYENPDDEYDLITGANYSYLCLSTTSGLTTADYSAGAGYVGNSGAAVNGAVIANHMTKNSPNGILWMAICLGMGTDTMYKPLRNRGVEVVYGYSESVTFYGDYLYEETFWDEMLNGKTVAQAVATMKDKWGNWDWSDKMVGTQGYDNIQDARDDFVAFPVVMSDEDTFPGKRTAGSWDYSGFYGADSLQTVNSTYTLGELEPDIEVDVPLNPDVEAGEPLTLSFATTVNRVSWNGSQQIWSQNGITVTNDKGATGSSVANYYNPVRFYAGSALTVEYSDMAKIVFRCSSASYATTLYSSIPAESGVTVTKSGEEVTVEFAQARAKFVIEKLNSQVRMVSITVYPAKVDKPADPIALKGVNINLGSSLSLNMNGLASVLDQYENVYVIYEAPGKEPVKVSKYFVSGAGDNLRYNFAYENLNILDINLNVSYTIYGTYDGVEYHSNTGSISMLYYCNAMIANPNSGVNEICANLLKYAMAAEAYMKVENPWMDDSGFLVNVMTDEQKANMEKYAYADDAVVVSRTSYAVNGDRVLFRSQALEMVSRITLRYKMSIADPTLDTSKVTFKVTYTDINGNPAVQNYSFSDLTYEEKTGYYVLDFSGFYATQMRQLAKCTIYIDGVEHGHFANSVESYCAAALGSSQTRDDVAYLVKRISLYGDACYAKYGN